MIRCSLSAIGLAAVAVAITILSYEGLRLPFVGQVIDGAIAHRLESYVLLSEKTAADALASEQERQKLAAQQSLEEYRKRAAAAEKLKDDANAELEKRIAADAADGGCSWQPADDEWLRHH